MESAFYSRDQAMANQSLAEYLASMNQLQDPQGYAKKTAELQDFNNKVTAGTGLVAAPFALSSIDGLTSSVKKGLESRAKTVARKAGLQVVEGSEGGVDVSRTAAANLRSFVSGAMTRLNPRIASKNRALAAQQEEGVRSLRDPVSSFIAGDNTGPPKIASSELPSDLSADFVSGFERGQDGYDNLIRDKGFLEDVPDRDEETVIKSMTLNPGESQELASDDFLEGAHQGILSRATQHAQAREKWLRSQVQAFDADEDMTRPPIEREPSTSTGVASASLEEDPDAPIQMGPLEVREFDDEEEPFYDAEDNPFSMPRSLGMSGHLNEFTNGLGETSFNADNFGRGLNVSSGSSLLPETSIPQPGEMLTMGGGQSLRGAAELEGGQVTDAARNLASGALGATQESMGALGTSADGAASAVSSIVSGVKATASGAAEDVAGQVASKLAPSLEALAAGGGPEDPLADIISLGLGLGTLFGGMSATREMPAPKLAVQLNDATERGL